METKETCVLPQTSNKRRRQIIRGLQVLLTIFKTRSETEWFMLTDEIQSLKSTLSFEGYFGYQICPHCNKRQLDRSALVRTKPGIPAISIPFNMLHRMQKHKEHPTLLTQHPELECFLSTLGDNNGKTLHIELPPLITFEERTRRNVQAIQRGMRGIAYK